MGQASGRPYAAAVTMRTEWYLRVLALLGFDTSVSRKMLTIQRGFQEEKATIFLAFFSVFKTTISKNEVTHEPNCVNRRAG